MAPRFRACLAVDRWVESLVEGRPYRDLDALLARARVVAQELTDEETLAAIRDHPRIGRLAEPGSATAAWSSEEQAGVDVTDSSVDTALRALNRDYERTFGHIYLVCATGLDGGRIVADLRRRLSNEPAAELTIVRHELAKIAELRLRRVVADLGCTEGRPA